MKTYPKNNEPMWSIKKCSYLAKFTGKHLCQCVFFNIVASLRPATLFKSVCPKCFSKVFFCRFCKIFQSTFFAEQLWVNASDIPMQVVVIYNLNLFLQFVTINFTFCLLRVFTLAHALMSLNFCVYLLFGRAF